MSTIKVLAVAPVVVFESALDWYERLFARAADARPMPGLADWHITDSAWVQVYHDPEHAGSTLLNLAVDDLDAELGDLAGRGITAGQVTTTSKAARLAALTDPSGNTITLIENPST